MEIGKRYAGKIFIDLLKKSRKKMIIDENGWSEFFAPAVGVSVLVVKLK